MPPKIIFHLTMDGLLHWQRATRFELYRLIAEAFGKNGIDVVPVRSTHSRGQIPKNLEDGNLHLVHGGNVKGIGWLNTSMAYLPGYWHINTVGILANSPARNAVYDPSTIKSRSANRFYTQLQETFSIPRRSRYWQPKERSEIPKNNIAVFLQGKYPYANRQSHMSMEEMLEEILSLPTQSHIVVKPHPLERDLGMSALRRFKPPGDRLFITDANIHDILEASQVAVSVNSSVSFEGFMHAKPAILFGRSDYSPLVKTVTQKGEFAAAYTTTLSESWDFKKMLYWYFKRHAVPVRSRKMLDVLAREISLSGLNPNAFGLATPRADGQET